jgi:SAM-dependent methyltransferase
MSNSQTQDIPFELRALADAHRYQNWLASVAMPFLGDSILELGSGIGSMSQHLPQRKSLILSDVEDPFIAELKTKFSQQSIVQVQKLDVQKPLIDQFGKFQLDTIVSFNVLEHIENDTQTFREMVTLLRSSKHNGPKRIVSLVPAHQWAFGCVDKIYGHHRRYSKRSFRSLIMNAGGQKLSSRNYHEEYLNLPALLGWWWNGKIIGNTKIGKGNIQAFEALMPILRPLDQIAHQIFRIPFGNSLLTSYQVDE